MKQVVLEGHFDAMDRAADEFPLLPFEVPSGIARLHVRYQVNRQLSGDKVGWEEGNIVDIGLFDPRGAEFLAAKGFRGWSGTSRKELTIAADGATPCRNAGGTGGRRQGPGNRKQGARREPGSRVTEGQGNEGRSALVPGRPARPHLALRRFRAPCGPGGGRPRPGARLRRRHRAQHGQPPTPIGESYDP